MIYVGVDIAKKTHFASVISSDDEILAEPFEFSNDDDGFHKLTSCLNSFEKDNLIIGLRSTAHYGNNLVFFYMPCSRKLLHSRKSLLCI
ncbi:transposase [Wukongibacter baidiensis]|uniref:IS110 family transposase n=1 Tax=Wukongibacter baidiensis TaxID=1723361 RepID=UPI003D7F54E3